MRLKVLRDIYSNEGSLHHACLIQGDKENVVEELFKFLEAEVKLIVKGNPDVQHIEYDTFGVDDGKLLIERSSQKGLAGKKVFIASFNTMTGEAQNALLKLFEEPTPETHFFLVTPNAEKILLTLRSRMLVLEERREVEEDAATEARIFLSSTPKERLAKVKAIVDEKDKDKAQQFLSAIEECLHDDMKGAKEKKQHAEALLTIENAKAFLFNRGSSLKLLLEHVALTTPSR